MNFPEQNGGNQDQHGGSSADYAAWISEAQTTPPDSGQQNIDSTAPGIDEPIGQPDNSATPDQAPPGYKGRHAEITRKRIWSPLNRLAMKNFEGRMGKMMTEVQDPHDEKVVLGSQEARKLIQNDGKQTYVVHSTTPDRLDRIIDDGLAFEGKYGQPEVPDLIHTGIMLAGPQERAATQRNIHNLAYRYGDEHSNIKLVYAFDKPNPASSLKDNPFDETFLGQADGENIKQISAEGEGKYVIPSDRLVGYFDLNTGKFTSKAEIDAKRESTST